MSDPKQESEEQPQTGTRSIEVCGQSGICDECMKRIRKGSNVIVVRFPDKVLWDAYCSGECADAGQVRKALDKSEP